MVTVRLFGTLRLDTKRKSLEVQARTVAEMLEQTALALGLSSTAPLRQSVVFVNGERLGLRGRLQDGDEVHLLSPVAGG